MSLEKSKEYIYGNLGIDDIVATVENNNTYYYHKDILGSVIGITDSSGAILEEYRYDIYGKPYIWYNTNNEWVEFNSSLIGNSRLFTGREYDSEIGLYYYRARYYDADLGRFISRDPIDTADNINLYSYVGNNPVNGVDPSGKAKQIIADIFMKARNDALARSNLGSRDLKKMQAWYDMNVLGHDLILEGGDLEQAKGFKKEYLKNGNILINGKRYPRGEVGNVLVGYKAKNIGYTLSYLKTGAFGYVLMDPKVNNGINGEYIDEELYDAGYDLGNNFNPTADEIAEAIDKGTKNRYYLSQNMGIENYTKLGLWYAMNGTFQGVRYIYDKGKDIYNML